MRSWLEKRRKAKERAASLAELAAAELSTTRQRARLDNLVVSIGHQVSEALEPLLTTKFATLPDNEVNAAIEAVLDAIDAVDLSDDKILEADADPEVLARQIRQPHDPGLSELATRLYDIALDQACRYLVQVVRQLPAFAPRAVAEMLGRATALTAQLDELLSRVPRTSLHAPQGTENDEEFRDEYLRFIANTLDRLELLGLSMRERPALALSVAYLSLTVSETEDRRGADQWFAAKADQHRTRTRVEAALTERTLVRGEAGSGKTTLLDWLAVTAARGEFTDQRRKWNGYVPLPIRLRRYVDTPLPRPEQFLDEIAPLLAGLMPQGWVHRCLRSGEALLLVDGVDELPPRKRRRCREWLYDLCGAFPLAKIVVTARPAAVDWHWLTAQGFTSVLLEQMGPADIKAFLERWHEAARDAESLPCPVDALPDAQRRLLSQLDSRPHVRALAANPLLCAMLCALNLGRTAQLPHNRMELYHAALGMLLELRDAEREVAGLLSMTEKSVLLRDLAWRLTLGNRSQLPTVKVHEHVERKVRSMPNTVVEPDVIVEHLLERSGVIREPAVGQVDFVHRTFQEYLAAAEAIQDGQIDALIAHAHLDSWRETVVMACGHAQRNQVGELLTGILDRADAEPSRARRLRLLAAACLETVTDVAVDVHDRIDAVIRDRLVPPRSTRETESLASIGHLVLRYLPTELTGLSDAAAAATVRTVAFTTTPEAMKRLATYASDPRAEVQNELIEGWQYFDPQRYANEVLADAPLNDGTVTLTSRRLLAHLPALRNATGVAILLPYAEPLRTFEVFKGVRNLKVLRVTLGGDIDFAALAAHRDLESLDLSQKQKHEDLGFLKNFRSLLHLALDDLAPNVDFSPLDYLPSLRTVSFDGWPVEVGLDALRRLPGLRSLRLAWHTCPEVLDGISEHLPEITELILLGDVTANLAAVRGMPKLRKLYIGHDDQTVDLQPLAGMSVTLVLPPHNQYFGLEDLGPDVRVRRR